MTTEAILKKAATARKGRWSRVMQAKSTPFARVVMFWVCTRIMFRSMVALKTKEVNLIYFITIRICINFDIALVWKKK